MPNYPKSGQVYTIEEVMFQLDLPDAPYLSVCIEDDYYPIQTSHMTFEQTAEALKGTKWKYQFTTHEWIPVFRWSDDSEVKLEDVVEHRPDDYQDVIVYPKGYPR
jgi:hypothetical protein